MLSQWTCRCISIYHNKIEKKLDHVFFSTVLNPIFCHYLSASGRCLCLLYVLTCTNRLLKRTHMNDKMKKAKSPKFTIPYILFDKPFEMDQTNLGAWISLLVLAFLFSFFSVFFCSLIYSDFCFALYFSFGFKFPSHIAKCFRNIPFFFIVIMCQCIDIEGVFKRAIDKITTRRKYKV